MAAWRRLNLPEVIISKVADQHAGKKALFNWVVFNNYLLKAKWIFWINLRRFLFSVPFCSRNMCTREDISHIPYKGNQWVWQVASLDVVKVAVEHVLLWSLSMIMEITRLSILLKLEVCRKLEEVEWLWLCNKGKLHEVSDPPPILCAYFLSETKTLATTKCHVHLIFNKNCLKFNCLKYLFTFFEAFL